MLVLNKFVVHAALLLGECPEQPHLPEEPMGGRLPQPRGPAIYGTYSRYPGTGTIVSGTSTHYY
jgi:hypothetical protein